MWRRQPEGFAQQRERRSCQLRTYGKDVKSMTSFHCRRHCLSLTLQFLILYESCLVFMNTALGCLLGIHQRMDRGKQGGIDDDGETSIHVGDVCTCVF